MRKYVRYVEKREFDELINSIEFGAHFADPEYNSKGIPNIILTMSPTYKIVALKNENKPKIKKKKAKRKKKHVRSRS